MSDLPAGLRPMSDAPRDATWIVLWYARGCSHYPVAAHWADGDGDGLMPPYRGWFQWDNYGTGFVGVDGTPAAWSPIEGVRW